MVASLEKTKQVEAPDWREARDLAWQSGRGLHEPQARGPRQLLLACIESRKVFEFQLYRACDVQHIERTAAKRRCVFAAQIAGSVEGSPPKHVRLFVTTASEVIFQGGKRSFVSLFGDDTAVQGQADAVRQFESAMTRYYQWVADFAPPSCHRARFRLL